MGLFLAVTGAYGFVFFILFFYKGSPVRRGSTLLSRFVILLSPRIPLQVLHLIDGKH